MTHKSIGDMHGGSFRLLRACIDMGGGQGVSVEMDKLCEKVEDLHQWMEYRDDNNAATIMSRLVPGYTNKLVYVVGSNDEGDSLLVYCYDGSRIGFATATLKS